VCEPTGISNSLSTHDTPGAADTYRDLGGGCWPKVTITWFMVLMITNICGYLVLIKFKCLSIFQGSKNSRSFLPLKESVEDSGRFKYGIKAQSTR